MSGIDTSPLPCPSSFLPIFCAEEAFPGVCGGVRVPLLLVPVPVWTADPAAAVAGAGSMVLPSFLAAGFLSSIISWILGVVGLALLMKLCRTRRVRIYQLHGAGGSRCRGRQRGTEGDAHPRMPPWLFSFLAFSASRRILSSLRMAVSVLIAVALGQLD